MDFTKLFFPEISIIEIILRASILYFGILVVMRILPRRTGGELAVMDLIFIILIADAAAQSLGNFTSITDGFIAIITLVIWNFIINWITFRFPFFEKIFSAPALCIIKNGKMIKKNMRIEYITEEELMEQLRKEGIEDITLVKSAQVESDGTISIIKSEIK